MRGFFAGVGVLLCLGVSGAAAQTTSADRAVPRYAHIIVIFEENKNYEQILNPAMAPNITALAAKYGYRTDLTFYTLHGDLFAYLCGIITLTMIPAMTLSARRRQRRIKIKIAW